MSDDIGDFRIGVIRGLQLAIILQNKYTAVFDEPLLKAINVVIKREGAADNSNYLIEVFEAVKGEMK